MGKLRRLKKLRRALRGTYVDPSDVVLQALPGPALVGGDASRFYVGMRVSGPPEAFGLPPDPGCAVHATGTFGCFACYPPRAPVTVTAVDHATGTITLSTAAP